MTLDDAYTVALLHMDGADTSQTFTDESGKTWTARGHAQIDTAQSKFGGASGLLDGTDDYIDTPNSADFDFGTGNFTIDLWVRRNGNQADYSGLVGAGLDATGAGWWIQFGSAAGGSTNKIILYANTGNRIVSNTTIADTTWTHIAVVRNGNTVTMYFVGSSVGTYDCTGVSFNSTGAGCVIGRESTDANNYYLNGHLDEVRISKGIARWTANFTPPDRAYDRGIQAIWF
jgi:hypothetical protein